MLFESIINFYVLSLCLELAIVPVLAFLGGMLGVAESDTKHKSVKTLLDRVFTILGAVLISRSLYQAATHFNTFGTSATLKDLVFAHLMSLAFLPFLYIMAVFVTYENLFGETSLFHQG